MPVPPAPPSATATLVGHLVQGLYEDNSKPAAEATLAIEVDFARPPKAADPDSYRRFVLDSMVVALRQKGWTGERVAAKANPSFIIEISLTADLGKNLMLAQARLRRMPLSIWERLRFPQGVLRKNAPADVQLDLEIRSILGMTIASFPSKNALYLRGSKLHHKELLSNPILAILIKDLNDDRVPEVAFLQRNQLKVARYRGKAFQEVVAGYDLRKGARPNASKLRDPIASLIGVTQSDGRTLLVAATSDYSEPLAFRVTPESHLQALPMRVGGGAWPLYALGVNRMVGLDWPVGTDVLRGPVNELGLKDGSAMMSQASLEGAYMLARFDHRILNPEGMVSGGLVSSEVPSRVSWMPQFLSVSTDYDVFVSDSQQGEILRQKHGTASYVVDLNHDGEPEILATGTGLTGDDVLTLYSKRETGYVPITSVSLTKDNVRGQVTALSFGDVDRDGRSEFVVASHDGRRSYLGVVEVGLTQ